MPEKSASLTAEEYFYAGHLCAAPSLRNAPYFFPDMQTDLQLLGNGAASDARQHVKVTQTKGAVEGLAIFGFVRAAESGPTVWQR